LVGSDLREPSAQRRERKKESSRRWSGEIFADIAPRFLPSTQVLNARGLEKTRWLYDNCAGSSDYSPVVLEKIWRASRDGRLSMVSDSYELLVL
jgi:hypothetical protein